MDQQFYIDTIYYVSNTGSQAITQYAHEQLRDGSNRREDLVLADLEHLVTQGAFDENGIKRIMCSFTYIMPFVACIMCMLNIYLSTDGIQTYYRLLTYNSF